MSGTDEKEPKHVYRLKPCPYYDNEAMESWLTDMAAQGLMLTGAGFLASFGFFDKVEPQTVAYRLKAAPAHMSLWFEANPRATGFLYA